MSPSQVRGVVLGLLVPTILADAVACLGSGSGGDGLGGFFPILVALALVPIQGLAGAAWWASGARIDPDGDTTSEVATLEPPTTAALVLVGVPTGVMAVVVVLELAVGHADALFTVAEPGTLLWGPMWAIGCIATGIALGRGEPRPLVVVPAYPLLGLAYMFS